MSTAADEAGVAVSRISDIGAARYSQGGRAKLEARRAMLPRILLIEDDAQLGGQTAERLRRAGYAVDWHRDADHVAVATPFGYDLVILDLKS
jgi:hypothetical protein